MDRKEATLRKWIEEANKAGFKLIERVSSAAARYACHACMNDFEAFAGNVRKGTAICPHCKEQKWRDEAALLGLEFLHKVTAADALYRCSGCQGSFRAACTTIRSKGFRCPHCQHNRWKTEAEASGLRFIKQISPQKASYACGTCSGEFEAHIAVVRNGFRTDCGSCPHCMRHKWEAEAARAGLRFLGNLPEHMQALYQCLACDEEFPARFGSVRSCDVRCRKCKTTNWSEQAAQLGYRFLRKVDKRKAAYTCDQCDEEFTAQVGNVAQGTVTCPICVPNQSAGEKAVATYLTKRGIAFTRQYPVRLAASARPRRFDFRMDDRIIEFDGPQHFIEANTFVARGSTGPSITERIAVDAMKTQYCVDAAIPLYRIHYSVLRRGKMEEALELIMTLNISPTDPVYILSKDGKLHVQRYEDFWKENGHPHILNAPAAGKAARCFTLGSQ